MGDMDIPDGHIEKNEGRLETILMAIRNVNQLITKGGDRDRLVRNACESLVAAWGFSCSWIASQDHPEGLIHITHAKLEGSSCCLQEIFAGGGLPFCAHTALAGPGIVVTSEISDKCIGCLFERECKSNAVFCLRLEKDGEIFGILNAVAPRRFADDLNEQLLFTELGDGIAFVLYNIKQEERHNGLSRNLKESEARYKAVFEGAAEGILIAEGSTKKIRYSNPAICRMLGYAETEFREMEARDIHASVRDRRFLNLAAQERENKPFAQHNMQFWKKDGTILYADVVMTPWISTDGCSLYAIFLTEVAETKNADDDKKNQEKQPCQAQTREATGRLTGVVDDDFNNALTTAIGDSEDLSHEF